ncbi:MAG TPA: dynamin family protein [Gammaproteobacteria bacterium]|nr:dynamin family protein [Gammaproteobacteria bacterium]
MDQAVEPISAQRARSLEEHLQQENPLLLQVLKNFRKLDKLGQRMGLLGKDESYTLRVSWWPVISILGTFSSGKSTFLNEYLGQRLQLTGNQAVDDRFTAICYSAEGDVRVLPGAALDADPRFPFYRISEEIDEATSGEGDRVDTYLQLKTCPSERLKRKIFLDSPGFDADKQRDATLRITDRIIDLSDLVLVMFDARHPEPGAMRDTLQHLVGQTITRPDASKFMYILNQIDAAATEDNPEDVVAAWQRALASHGLTAGRFYRIYNEEVSSPIPDEARQSRFKAKKDEDLAEIYNRIQEVEVGRAYRVVDVLAQTAKDLEEAWVPRIDAWLDRWRRRVWIYNGIVLLLAIALTIACYIAFTTSTSGIFGAIGGGGIGSIVSGIVLFIIAMAIHFGFRRLAARQISARIRKEAAPERLSDLLRAFRRNTRWSRNMLARNPAGWGIRARRLVNKTIENRTRYVQDLNDRFANPSGREQDAPALERRQSSM